MKQLLSPRTARHARLFRLVSALPSAPSSDGEKLSWVNSHVKRNQDKELSREEERLRESLIPLDVRENSMTANSQTTHGNLFHFRDYPMYPGEYIPPQHNTLSSLRDSLKFDLMAQSLKEAWMRVSGGMFFNSVHEYYSSVDGLDEEQLGEIVSALFPDLNSYESRALVNHVLETITNPRDSPSRQLSRVITADTVGLDNAPNHYTNFLEWMGRMTETRAFKTEHALFEFSRRKFNKTDVQIMFENYNLMSKAAIELDSADGYTHFYTVLKDFSRKVSGEDTRHQIGVRIDEEEIDLKSGIAVGHGRADGEKYMFTALIRENRDHNGSVTLLGKPLSTVFDNKSWLMEMVLMPFDEAKLNYRDFDVNIVSEGKAMPSLANDIAAFACRMAVANAITKLIPLTRIPIKKAGLLSVDRRKEPGQFPGFVDGNLKMESDTFFFFESLNCHSFLALLFLSHEALEMIAFLLIAALVWGVTNPFLKRYSAGMKESSTFKEDFIHLMRRPGYLCIQFLNISGSVFFFYALREVQVSIASVVVNSLAFVITLVTSSFILSEGGLRTQTIVGCFLVVAGTGLCTLSRTRV